MNRHGDLVALCLIGLLWLGAVCALRPALASLPRERVVWRTEDHEDWRFEAQCIWYVHRCSDAHMGGSP